VDYLKYVEKYDISITPSHPFLKVAISNPITNEELEEKAYIDTGFSGSLIITKSIFKKLNLNLIEIDETYYAIHAGCFITKLSPVIAVIRIKNFYHKKMKIFVHPYIDKILMGREILNEVYLCLNGPKQVLEILYKS